MFLDLPVATTFACFAVLLAIELLGPFLAERKAPTPWHAHHIAERYGLLTIITLGEVIIGTIAALNALVHGEAGWTTDAVLLTIAGVGLCFGCWWAYFAIPWGEAIERRRRRAFVFGYGHLLIFGSLAAMGAGLHVAAYYLEGEAKISDTVDGPERRRSRSRSSCSRSTRSIRWSSASTTPSTCSCSRAPPRCWRS